MDVDPALFPTCRAASRSSLQDADGRDFSQQMTIAMSRYFSVSQITLLLLSLCSRALCDDDSGWEDGGQFIYYNGTISGSYVFNQRNLSSCGDNGTFYFSGLDNSYMRIGVDPPWDHNPFFFELGHYGNDWQSESNSSNKARRWPQAMRTGLKERGALETQQMYRRRPVTASKNEKRDICFGVGGCTYDAIYNLAFSTVWYACQQDGHGCPYITSNWYEVAAEMVNLNASSVSVVDNGAALTNSDNSPFYSVSGDEKIWVSNGTVNWNSFNFQVPQNYSTDSSDDCETSTQSVFNW
jgi:hypothetical protein